MAGPGLLINNDFTYPDDGSDPSVHLHQTDHDAIHKIVNHIDKDTLPAGNGQVWVSTGGVMVPQAWTPAWTTTTSLANSWTGSVAYRKTADGLHLMVDAALTTGTYNTSPFTFPAGCRPTSTRYFLGVDITFGVAAMAALATSGVLTLFSTTAHDMAISVAIPLDI